MKTNYMNPANHSSPRPRKGECIETQMLVDYADGKLIGKQAHEVESHLAACPLCADALEGIIAFGNSEEFMSTVNELNEMAASRAQQPVFARKAPRKKTGFLALGSIVSAAAVLLLVFIILPKGPAAVAANYYKAYPGDGVRSQGEPDQAMALYNESKFSEAAMLFSQIDDSKSQFFAGNAYIEIKEYDKAISAFGNVIARNDSFFVTDAKYYMGLAYLFKGDKENALKLMHELASVPNGDYSDKAASIIKELE